MHRDASYSSFTVLVRYWLILYVLAYCYNIVNEIHEITPFNQMRLNWSVSLNWINPAYVACNPLMPIHSRFNARDELRQLIGVAAPFVIRLHSSSISFRPFIADWNEENEWLLPAPCFLQLNSLQLNSCCVAPLGLLSVIIPLHSIQLQSIRT